MSANRYSKPGRCRQCLNWAQLNSADHCVVCGDSFSNETFTKLAVTEDRKSSPTASYASSILPEAPPGYTLIDEIGHGGMGIVFRALERATSRVVAIKYMSTRLHRTSRERFEREAQALANLQHPSLIRIFSVNLDARDPFFMMEYLEGGSLSRRLKRGPLAAEEAATLLLKIALGVATAHAAGILHRDLKPSNILLDEFHLPKVADFGLAKWMDDPHQADLTRTESLIGTPCYMSPEQAERRHADVDTRSDVYSLGATLYECLTGRPPFEAETTTDTLTQVRVQNPILPSVIIPNLAPEIEAICLRCLEKDPNRRYQSSEALADDLDRWLKGLPTTAKPAGPWVKGLRTLQKHRASLILLLAVMIVLALIPRLEIPSLRATRVLPAAGGEVKGPAGAKKEADGIVPESALPTLVPTPGFAPDRTEETIRQLLQNRESLELVDERGPRLPLIQGFGSAQLVQSPNRDSALSLFTRDHSVLLLLRDPGIDRYRLHMEVRQDLKMRDMNAEWPTRYASVGLALACSQSSIEDGTAFFSFNYIGLTDQSLPVTQGADVGSIQIEESVLATRPLETSRTAGHTLHRMPLSELAADAKTRPLRTFQVDVTPEGVTLHCEGQKIFKPATDLRRGVGWREILHNSSFEKLSTSLIHPDWNTRSPIGIWCRGCWASVRRIIIGPIP